MTIITLKCVQLNKMFLPRCPELHFGAVRLLGHGHLVDLQVDFANLEDPALGLYYNIVVGNICKNVSSFT